mgnify:CR=1 FL=1
MGYSAFVCILAAIHTILTFAEISAFDSSVEALAVFFKTVGLFTVAASFVGQFRRLLPSNDL